MHSMLAHDLAQLPEILQTTCDFAGQTLSGINEHAAAIRPHAPAAAALPLSGMGAAAALATFQQRWAPGFSGSGGPRYLGFITGGATPAALAGDWLTSTFDQNPTSGLDSLAPDLERETIVWMRELFGLSAAQQGCFVSGATMSNMVGLALAREWLGEQQGINIAEQGLAALGPVTVLSGSAHSSVFKALSMLGIGKQALHKLPPQDGGRGGREAVDVAALEAALIAQQGKPCVVVCNAGTVNTGDFDDLSAIVALKQRYPFWLHVDGAFGAFAALVPELAHHVAALDAADSICLDCHKWLNVPYDSAVQFTRHRHLQIRVFQNSAAYLGVPDQNPDFVHLTPENSRRLRALASWFALAAYGRVGHAEIVARNIACAQALGTLLVQEARCVLLAPVNMNIVCFTLASPDDAASAAGMADEAAIKAFLQRLQDGGEVFLTPTVLHGRWAIRAAFSNWRTDMQDVARIFAAIQAALA